MTDTQRAALAKLLNGIADFVEVNGQYVVTNATVPSLRAAAALAVTVAPPTLEAIEALRASCHASDGQRRKAAQILAYRDGINAAFDAFVASLYRAAPAVQREPDCWLHPYWMGEFKAGKTGDRIVVHRTPQSDGSVPVFFGAAPAPAPEPTARETLLEGLLTRARRNVEHSASHAAGAISRELLTEIDRALNREGPRGGKT